MAYNNTIIYPGSYTFIDSPDLSSFTSTVLYDVDFTCGGQTYTGFKLTSKTIDFYREVTGYHFVNEVQWDTSWSVTDDNTTYTYEWQSDTTSAYNSIAIYTETNERSGEVKTVTFTVSVDKTTGKLSGTTNHNNASNNISNEDVTYTTRVYENSAWKDDTYKSIVANESSTGQTFAKWFGTNTTAVLPTYSYEFDETMVLPASDMEQTLNFVSYGSDFTSIKITSSYIYYCNNAQNQVYNTSSKWNANTSHMRYITLETSQTVSGLFYSFVSQQSTKYEKTKLPSPTLTYTTSSTGYIVTFTNSSSNYECYALVNGSSWSSSAISAKGEVSKSYEWEDDKNSYTFKAYAYPTNVDMYEQSDETELIVYKDWLNEPITNAVDVDDDVTNITIKNTNNVAVTYYVNDVLQSSIGAGESVVYAYTWGKTQTSIILKISFKDQTGKYGGSSTAIALAHKVKLPAPTLTIVSNDYDSYSFSFTNTSSQFSVQPYFDNTAQGNTLGPGETRVFSFSWESGQTSRTIQATSNPTDTTLYVRSDATTLTITRATEDLYALDIEYEGAHYTFGGSGSVFVLEPATTSTLGGIIVGDNLSINESGVLSANASAYTLPTATANVLGGVKIGYTNTDLKYGVQLDTNSRMFVNIPVATTTASGLLSINAQTIVGTKTFTSSIITNQITSQGGYNIARHDTTANKIVLGCSSLQPTIIGSTERPYYTNDVDDLTGVPLALLSDCSGSGGQEYATLVETLPEI